ncbi:MAG: hypothetical protein JO197_11865 [Acidobacteria bacterium]|nr:hypothetical protein [Acidobacteriota bacterium]MBV9476173.1 hypothetical protein [Acidobacteriota bacterium]
MTSPAHFQWRTVKDAKHYTVTYVLNGHDNQETPLGTTDGTDLVAAVPAGEIKWRVMATSDNCATVGPTSDWFQFTVNAPPPPPPHDPPPPPPPHDPPPPPPPHDPPPPACNPAIAISPASSSILSGQTVTLLATVTGSSSDDITWYEGAAGDRSKTSGHGERFTSRELMQSTRFWAEASTSCGKVSSNVAVVNVCTPPSITTTSADANINAGQTTTLSVTAGGDGPFTYQWYEGAVGTRTKPVGGNASSFTTPALSGPTTYWVEVTGHCGDAASSRAIRVNVAQSNPATCDRPSATSASSVATITSGVDYVLRWTRVDNASRYRVEEATDASFSNASSQTVQDVSATFRHTVTTSTAYFYRVRAVADCDASILGDASRVVRVAVVPPPAHASKTTDLVAPYGAGKVVVADVDVRFDAGVTSFTASASESWLTVTPASGGVPPAGFVTFTLSADPRALPHGTSTASLRVNTVSASASGVATNGGTTMTVPISVSLVTPVTPAMPTNGGEVMIIPAVAHAAGAASQWQSDVRISHTYTGDVKYRLTFTPTGSDATSAVQTDITVREGETVALDDILGHWFGAGMANDGAAGVLEIRTLDAIPGSGRTYATSRLFNVAAEGTFGQFISAVPLQKFLGMSLQGDRQTLVSLAQSSAFRTNLGVVEGSGHGADVVLEVFDGAGTKLFDMPMTLKGGEHRQIGSALAASGVDLTNARVDLRVVSPVGSAYAYASVIDNTTGDPSFVPPVDVDGPRARRYTIAGVANLPVGDGLWQTDVRLYNGDNASAEATIEFYAQGSSEPTATRTVTVNAGETLALDDVLPSLFGLSGVGGALRITTPTASALVPAARTYHRHDSSTYGQFISAATDENAAGLGDEPLRILQIEESDRFRTNVGIAEVSGHVATIEVTASVPDHKIAAVTQLDLQPNEFVQMNGLLRSMGVDDAYNASVTLRVIGGDGRVIGYASVIDNRTQDPTYVMAQ